MKYIHMTAIRTKKTKYFLNRLKHRFGPLKKLI